MAYNTIALSENELLQETATINTQIMAVEDIGIAPLGYWVANVILDNYESGIISGELNTATGDLKIGSSIIKNWANGDVLQLGDIVQLNKNNGNSAIVDASNNPVHFKITGRKFRYAGCPLLDIEFMQIK